MVATLLAGLLGLSLAGCLQAPDCPVPEQAKVLTLPVPMAYLATDPGQPWDTVALAWPSPDAGAVRYQVDAGWNVSVERYASGGPVLERLRVQPGAGPATLTRAWSLAHDEAARSGSLAWDLRPPAAGMVAQPGMGVRVMAAGFWENGTLFYTNIPQVDQAAWPRAAWYAWSGADPLAVYVYGQDRGERGALWSASTAGTAAGPVTGNATAWDYATTIPGFNAALKGLSLNTARVVRVAPEDAYTVAGKERHPLYGAALVFYIKLVAVETLPCPDAPMLCQTMPAERGPAFLPRAEDTESAEHGPPVV
ncbi:MAG: hypothetical protein QOI63_964 [Thermoplasmata archaeon]|nr:hypothetical protein [Thermoplasmata archaeon]